MAKWPYNGPWPHVRTAILIRDNHECQIRGPHCQHTTAGDRCATTVDHIVSPHPPHNGAPYDPANLRAACPTCNYGRNPPTHYHPTQHGTTPPPASRDW